MENKDKINKISGIITIGTLSVILIGYLISNDSLFRFPNAFMLYALMPAALTWFGTRKNGCGSCNQSYSILEKEQTNLKNKN